MIDIEREEFLEWWESRHYDDEDKEVKKAAWCAWQAARQAPASGEVEPVGDFRAEIRTHRDESDEYVSFLAFVVNGKTHPYLHIPETLDQGILEEAINRLNTHPPAKVPEAMVGLVAICQHLRDCVDDRGTSLVCHRGIATFLEALNKAEAATEALLTTPTPATTPETEWVKCASCGDFAYECDVCGGKPEQADETEL